MGKWTDLANLEVNSRTAKNTKALAARQAQAAAHGDARIAYLEGRVAALEARMQWALDTIQHLQQAGQQRPPAQ